MFKEILKNIVIVFVATALSYLAIQGLVGVTRDFMYLHNNPQNISVPCK